MYSTLMLHVQDQTLVLTFWRTVVHLSDIAVQLRHAGQLIVPQPYVYSDFCACPFIVDVSCVLELASYIPPSLCGLAATSTQIMLHLGMNHGMT